MRVLLFWLALAMLPVVALLVQHEVSLSSAALEAKGTKAPLGKDLLVLEIGGSLPALQIPSARRATSDAPNPSMRRVEPEPQLTESHRERRPTPAPADPRFVVVARGETLYGIAVRELGDGSRWRDIAKQNGIAQGQEGTVKAGRRLLLPPRSRG